MICSDDQLSRKLKPSGAVLYLASDVLLQGPKLRFIDLPLFLHFLDFLHERCKLFVQTGVIASTDLHHLLYANTAR